MKMYTGKVPLPLSNFLNTPLAASLLADNVWNFAVGPLRSSDYVIRDTRTEWFVRK